MWIFVLDYNTATVIKHECEDRLPDDSIEELLSEYYNLDEIEWMSRDEDQIEIEEGDDL